jgi:DNA polymerase III sliding clamp (beta) subunit (PCNA family)
MKFEICRLEMLEAAKNAARVAPSLNQTEVLKGILIECDEDAGEVVMTATNFEQSIQQKIKASVDEGGAVLVNARMLVGIISLLPTDYITFSAVRPETVTITGGKSFFEISCLPAQNYPRPVMPFPEETVKLSGICSLARRTVFAVSKDKFKPVLQCVSVKFRKNAVHAAACDGIRLMMTKDEAYSSNQREVLLPGHSLQMLASISTDPDEYEVGDIGKEIVFTRNNLMFSMRKLPGEYIDTNTLLKAVVPAYSAVTDAGQMKEALDLVTAGAVGQETINVALFDGQIIIRRNSDYSEVQTTIPAVISKGTPDDGFYYDGGNLVKLFRILDGRVRIEIDAKGFMLAKTLNEVYLQVPKISHVKKAEETQKAA